MLRRRLERLLGAHKEMYRAACLKALAPEMDKLSNISIPRQIPRTYPRRPEKQLRQPQ